MNHSDLLREIHGFAKSKPVKSSELIAEANGITYSKAEQIFIQKLLQLEKELKLPRGRAVRYAAKVLGRTSGAIKYKKEHSPSYQELIKKYPELSFEPNVSPIVSETKEEQSVGKKCPRYSQKELEILKAQIIANPHNLSKAFENTAWLLDRHSDLLHGYYSVQGWFQRIRDKPEHADWVPGVGTKQGGYTKGRKNLPKREDGTYHTIPTTSTKNYIIWLGGYTSTST